jgi:hypothetical protein
MKFYVNGVIPIFLRMKSSKERTGLSANKTQSPSSALFPSLGWTLSAWWVLFPWIPLSLFLLRFEQVAQATNFVSFAQSHWSLRVLSLLVDQRFNLSRLWASFRFEDVMFMLSAVSFILTTSSKTQRRVALGVVFFHGLSVLMLNLILVLALRSASTTEVVRLLNLGGGFLVVLIVLQLVSIFGLSAAVIYRLKADELHES